MKPRNHMLRFFVFAIWAVGGVVFSQGVSFATWNESFPVGSQFNEHALLIAACGLGIFCCGFVIQHLLDRLQVVEEELSRQNEVDAERRFTKGLHEMSQGSPPAAS